jgi:non-ribosomal peptide synthetase component F
MHPKHHAASSPSKPAIIMAESGAVTRYARLQARSNQGAHLFRSLGLCRGDTIAHDCAHHRKLSGAFQSGLGRATQRADLYLHFDEILYAGAGFYAG